MTRVRSCPRCEGVGRHWDGRQILWLMCGYCNGKGYLELDESFEYVDEQHEIKESDYNPQVDKWGKAFKRRGL